MSAIVDPPDFLRADTKWGADRRGGRSGNPIHHHIPAVAAPPLGEHCRDHWRGDLGEPTSFRAVVWLYIANAWRQACFISEMRASTKPIGQCCRAVGSYSYARVTCHASSSARNFEVPNLSARKHLPEFLPRPVGRTFADLAQRPCGPRSYGANDRRCRSRPETDGAAGPQQQTRRLGRRRCGWR